ncbi:MAG: hypothetical protein K9G39_10665 [Chlorobium sp.]|uniref:hypothetical protein n=1 Tax=Chlorobium sp. TaxID=1095 RepID=UPI0025C71D78|nr:hypothetical protein [Chlorobium sp.]MCF8384030.1 hypothetical protein [Chlorobium sp.]
MAVFTRRRFLAGALALGMARFPFPLIAEPADCHTRRGLVLLADFPGGSHAVTEDFVTERFRKVSTYIREMSYGKACAEFDFTNWLLLPDPVSSYSISPANLKVDKSRVFRLVQDAIDAADDGYAFSRYDYVVIFMRASMQDYGMVGLCGYPGMLGWSRELVFKTKRRGQIVPNGVAIFTSNAHVGTLFHDIAHVWGGVVNGKRVVPCLYDHDLQERYPTRQTGFEQTLINMGYWDPMSCHLYQPNIPPPGISSWTRLRLGWLPLEKIWEVDLSSLPAEILLGPLEDGKSKILAIRIRLTATRYFLVENRQPVGLYDSVLPGHGVLIMKADDGIAECRNGEAPVRLVDANPDVRTLLGAAFDLQGKSRYVDPESGLEIRLIEKIRNSYRIKISQA